jgi:ferredoxin
MSKNIVFYFSGTGNSLKVAKDIAKEMPNCEIVSMTGSKDYDLPAGYETIGFVYPTYFRGEPLKVREFISNLNLQNNPDSYYYAVTTCGRYRGNALLHIRDILKKKSITLNYASKLDMFSNYVIVYDMSTKVKERAIDSEKKFLPIMDDIKNRRINGKKEFKPFTEMIYRILISFAPRMDRNYNVSDACTGCGICKKVCPVNNIDLDDNNRPYFKHHCEQCVACIQYCPQRAINYKNKTQNRSRYTNPSITYLELSKMNKKE